MQKKLCVILIWTALASCGSLPDTEVLQPSINLLNHELDGSGDLAYFTSWGSIPDLKDRDEPITEAAKTFNLGFMKGGVIKFPDGAAAEIHLLVGFSQPSWGPAANDLGAVGYGFEVESEKGEKTQIFFYETYNYSFEPPATPFKYFVMRKKGATVSRYTENVWSSGEMSVCVHPLTTSINLTSYGSAILLNIRMPYTCFSNELSIPPGKRFKIKVLTAKPDENFRVLDELIYNGWWSY